MPETSPDTTREFALDVVRRLRAAGHEALWAGGCVRDGLLGRPPADYDVATSATPDEVRRVFGRRRTLAIGAAFGVIVVRGAGGALDVEVATFRKDSPYSDGRHPDRVTFSNAKEDALRRDFTINGLFFDPIAEKTIDYVGGRDDLKKRVVRAIGDPRQRIAEDKLRMLRAVRFAAKFDFDLDPDTQAAIAECAKDLIVVSAERIAAEMRRVFTLPARVRCMRLLAQTGLLSVILPQVDAWQPIDPAAELASPDDAWQRVLMVLGEFDAPTFPQALAAVTRELPGDDPAEVVGRRWRLSLDEIKRTKYLVARERDVRRASDLPWPKLQRLLIAKPIGELLDFAQAIAVVEDGTTEQVDYCREKLVLPREQLNPPTLIDGDDLVRKGFRPGPVFATILTAIRDAQLDGKVSTVQQAMDMADRMWRDSR
jgi:poly(A) polymerase